jgi:hypothetical protein
MLNPADLTVETFQTSSISSLKSTDPINDCCTGCTSGCGINPTAGGCESASGDAMCPAEPGTLVA